MPVFNLAATGPTDWVPLTRDGCAIAVAGTFVATVAIEVRLTPNGAVYPAARDLAGNLLTFTAPSGAFTLQQMGNAYDAQVRANCTAFTSGPVSVQLGR